MSEESRPACHNVLFKRNLPGTDTDLTTHKCVIGLWHLHLNCVVFGNEERNETVETDRARVSGRKSCVVWLNSSNMWKKGGDGGGSRWRFNWLMTCPTVKSSTKGNCLIHLFLPLSVAYTMFLYCRTGYITYSCIFYTPLGFSHLMIFLL